MSSKHLTRPDERGMENHWLISLLSLPNFRSKEQPNGEREMSDEETMVAGRQRSRGSTGGSARAKALNRPFGSPAQGGTGRRGGVRRLRWGFTALISPAGIYTTGSFNVRLMSSRHLTRADERGMDNLWLICFLFLPNFRSKEQPNGEREREKCRTRRPWLLEGGEAEDPQVAVHVWKLSIVHLALRQGGTRRRGGVRRLRWGFTAPISPARICTTGGFNVRLMSSRHLTRADGRGMEGESVEGCISIYTYRNYMYQFQSLSVCIAVLYVGVDSTAMVSLLLK